MNVLQKTKVCLFNVQHALCFENTRRRWATTHQVFNHLFCHKDDFVTRELYKLYPTNASGAHP